MRAREFAKESFDRPYTLRWDRSDSEYEQYAVAMTDSGDRIVISFSKESTSAWSVEFTRGERISQTGTGDSPRVFATVLAAIQEFVKKQEPNMLVFTAVKSEAYSVPKRNDSRIKLYDRMIQRFAPAQGYQVEKRDLDQTVLYVLKRSDQPNQRVMENQTLEQYRQIALREIQQWSKTWRKAAEQNLGINIHRVSAVGSVTDPKRFTEDSDIDVAFYYSDPKKPQGLDEQLSEKLQQVFMQYAHRDLGVINTLVFNKHNSKDHVIAEADDLGDCFVVAGKAMLDNKIPELKLVHAYVTGQGLLKGRRFEHAWNEIGDVVFDNSNGRKIIMRKEQYYELGKVVQQPKQYAVYDRISALKKMAKTKHYGPWDLE